MQDSIFIYSSVGTNEITLLCCLLVTFSAFELNFHISLVHVQLGNSYCCHHIICEDTFFKQSIQCSPSSLTRVTWKESFPSWRLPFECNISLKASSSLSSPSSYTPTMFISLKMFCINNISMNKFDPFNHNSFVT